MSFHWKGNPTRERGKNAPRKSLAHASGYYVMMMLSLSLAATSFADTAPGDRHPDVHCVYPQDVFFHAEQGGQIIDVTKAPFGAKGDGVTNDSAALVAAYDFVLKKMDEHEWNASGVLSAEPEYIIYLPNGTYRVTDTIIYSEPWRTLKGFEEPRRGARAFERLVRIRFFGESRDGTIIRLDNNAKGFSEGERPVLSFGKSDLNNAVAYNSVRNLTIDTGMGNSGAIGLDFCGANNSGIHNVSVVSGDGKGVAGIDFRICPAMGYHDDITVRGFDHGLRMIPYHMTHNCFEYVTLEGQQKSGVHVGHCSTSIRKLEFTGDAPAIEVAQPSGHAVVLDSRLSFRSGNPKRERGTKANDQPLAHASGYQEERDGASSQVAVNAPAGHLYVRNLQTSGYGSAVKVAGKAVVPGNHVDEYVTGPRLSLGKIPQKASLRLPIEDTPQVPWQTDVSDWANVDDYGAVGDGETDDGAAIQAAMNSGKSVIYFPKPVYRFRTPVTIPANVRRITGLYGAINGMLHIAEDANEPLLMEDFGTESRTIVRHRAPRTLVMSHMRVQYFNENLEDDRGSSVKVFINNCNGLGKNDRVFKQGRFWVRFINTEYKQAPNFTCNDSDMWVFGYKVEGHMTNFQSIGGGRLEVLGGICNEHGGSPEPETPIMRCVDSELSFVGLTNGPNVFQVVAEESSGDQTERLMVDQCPSRPGIDHYTRWKDVFVPAFISSLHQQAE